MRFLLLNFIIALSLPPFQNSFVKGFSEEAPCCRNQYIDPRAVLHKMIYQEATSSLGDTLWPQSDDDVNLDRQYYHILASAIMQMWYDMSMAARVNYLMNKGIERVIQNEVFKYNSGKESQDNSLTDSNNGLIGVKYFKRALREIEFCINGYPNLKEILKSKLEKMKNKDYRVPEDLITYKFEGRDYHFTPQYELHLEFINAAIRDFDEECDLEMHWAHDTSRITMYIASFGNYTSERMIDLYYKALRETEKESNPDYVDREFPPSCKTRNLYSIDENLKRRLNLLQAIVNNVPNYEESVGALYNGMEEEFRKLKGNKANPELFQ